MPLTAQPNESWCPLRREKETEREKKSWDGEQEDAITWQPRDAAIVIG